MRARPRHPKASADELWVVIVGPSPVKASARWSRHGAPGRPRWCVRPPVPPLVRARRRGLRSRCHGGLSCGSHRRCRCGAQKTKVHSLLCRPKSFSDGRQEFSLAAKSAGGGYCIVKAEQTCIQAPKAVDDVAAFKSGLLRTRCPGSLLRLWRPGSLHNIELSWPPFLRRFLTGCIRGGSLAPSAHKTAVEVLLHAVRD
jgi:hypothetical protein